MADIMRLKEVQDCSPVGLKNNCLPSHTSMVGIRIRIQSLDCIY